jgi:hypothetical protein
LALLAAKFTAITGNIPLTITVFNMVMPMLLSQRMLLEVVRGRRGEEISHMATATKIPKKAVNLRDVSFIIIVKFPAKHNLPA